MGLPFPGFPSLCFAKPGFFWPISRMLFVLLAITAWLFVFPLTFVYKHLHGDSLITYRGWHRVIAPLQTKWFTRFQSDISRCLMSGLKCSLFCWIAKWIANLIQSIFCNAQLSFTFASWPFAEHIHGYFVSWTVEPVK